MIDQDMVDRLYDCQVIDPRGEKIGSVKRVWLDGRTGDPAWASVHTGLFGLRETFVPLQRAELRDEQVRVPVAKEQVKDAPHVEADGDEMSEAEQQRLYRYYGVTPSGDQRGWRDRADQRGMVQQPGSVQRSSGLTRSEERLRVGTEDVETGRVRLVKHVVTEDQQVTVPVSREEARVERVPVTDRDAANAEIGAVEQEVHLHAEKPVVRKETVPVERVRLGKEKVAEQETVSDQVRKEQIDVENDDASRGHRPLPR